MGIFSVGRSTAPIGLDIGTGHFRAAQIIPGSTTNTLVNYAKIKVPVGSVVEGEIIDVDTVAQSLAQLWKKSGLSNKNVTIGIASQKVIVRLIELPFMEKSELKGAIQYQAQDYIPIPVDEAIIDAQIVNQFLGENDEKLIEVLLVAAQKDLINNTVSAVEKGGLRPQVVDLSAFAIVRSLLGDTNTFLPEDEGVSMDGATALINIGSGLTNIVVVEDGMPRFARITPMAGDDLNRAISDALGVSFEVADELKRQVGLPKLEQKTDENQINPAEGSQEDVVRRVLETQISYFVAEVRRSLDYYLTQATKVRKISRIIVSGNGAKLANITDYLENGLQSKVELGNPLANIKISSKLETEALAAEERSMAIPIGLALQGL